MTDKTRQVAFRFPESLIERIDAYAKQMEEQMPGLRFTRADAVRVLIEKGLIASSENAETGRTKKTSR